MFLKPKHFIFECRPNFGSFCPLPGLLRAITFSAPNPPLYKFLRTPLDTGEKITSLKEMANMLNNYFSEIGQKLAANIELTNSANIRSSTSFITQRCTSLYLQPITESDILKHIRQLNPSKSTGPDGIPIKYIAMSALIIAPVLTRLYNSCRRR